MASDAESSVDMHPPIRHRFVPAQLGALRRALSQELVADSARHAGRRHQARLALLAASIELERTDPDQSLYG